MLNSKKLVLLHLTCTTSLLVIPYSTKPRYVIAYEWNATHVHLPTKMIMNSLTVISASWTKHNPNLSEQYWKEQRLVENQAFTRTAWFCLPWSASGTVSNQPIKWTSCDIIIRHFIWVMIYVIIDSQYIA
jgi:hypothetical protein